MPSPESNDAFVQLARHLAAVDAELLAAAQLLATIAPAERATWCSPLRRALGDCQGKLHNIASAICGTRLARP